MEYKVKLTITTVRRRTVRVTGTAVCAPCRVCGHEVEALTRSQAGEILEVGAEELGAFLAAGRVHAIQTASGGLRVCKDSLFSQ